MQIHRLGAGVFTIDGFLSAEECAALIAQSEKHGYSEAAIRTEDGERLYKDARNNDRIVFDDRALAASMFLRAQSLLPAELDGWRVSRFNERWRYYRYDREQQFTWHLDGTVRPGTGEESFLTFMIYLNEDFEGGATTFPLFNLSVKPEIGKAILFPSSYIHSAEVITRGEKYVLVSWLTSTPPIKWL